MKIEIDKVGSKKYYDEFLYILSNYKRILDNPRIKAKSSVLTFLYTDIICVLTLAMCLFFYLKDKDIIFGILSIVFILFLIIFTTLTIAANMRIKNLMSKCGKKVIDITQDFVCFTDDSKEIKVKWNDIAYIVINTYSICFIPKSIDSILISINVDYKEKVLEAIKEVDKTDLIVDNT